MDWYYWVAFAVCFVCCCGCLAALCVNLLPFIACWCCWKGVQYGYRSVKNYSEKDYEDQDALNEDVVEQNVGAKQTLMKLQTAVIAMDPELEETDITDVEEGVPLKQFKFEPEQIGQLALFQAQANGFIARYELGKRLNSGAEGVTYLAKDKSTGRTVVVKQPIKLEAGLSDFAELKDKTHPNIVRVFEHFKNPLEEYVVMECCSGGDLFGALEGMMKSYGPPSQNWCAAVGSQAFAGVSYLHQQFMQSHNDLKPENILLDHKPTSAIDVPRVMIGDFGMANFAGAVTQQTGGGDPRYRAPEIWQGQPFGFRSDVWALGVTLYELLSGGLLIYVYQRNISGWGNFRTAMKEQLCKQFIGTITRYPTPPVDLSPIQGDAPRDLLQGLLNVNKQDRFTVEQARNHPWFMLASSATPVSLGGEAGQRLQERAKGSKLRIGLLNLVATTLQGESLKYYTVIWNEYDEGGVMTLKKFEKMWKDNDLGGKNFGGSVTAKDVFTLADADRSGYISFNQFVAIMFNPDELDDQERKEYLKASFKILAGDSDQITLQALESLFVGQSTDVLKELFADIDKDGSGVIDYQEFADYIEAI